ncbi:MAG: Na+/H+ antiporter NhaC family protein [Bacteroidia bacterium]|nr:Na+/H+ antiporter NhaC family protein [Bacteroidia bacterium]
MKESRYTPISFIFGFLIFFLPSVLSAQESVFSEKNVSVKGPEYFRINQPGNIEITLSDTLARLSEVEVSVEGKSVILPVNEGVAIVEFTPSEVRETLSVRVGDYETELETEVAAFPLWLSIFPPLIAILMALIFREVIVSLFMGIFFGAAALGYFQSGSLAGIFSGFLDVVEKYVITSITDPDHVSIIVFSMLIGGMVAVISRNGGMQGIVNVIAKFAKTAVTGQFATWLLGLVIFFDDYANSLVVGNTMRSVTDRLRVSREKLSYLVDSTAAPVSALAFITTWIGAELGYIEDGISQLDNFPEGLSPYSIFLSSVPYAFYPILTLIFMLFIIFTRRDFGPMYKAEERARKTGKVSLGNTSKPKDSEVAEDVEEELRHFQPMEGVSPRAFNAVIPVAVLVGGVLAGLVYTGYSVEVWSNPEMGFLHKLSQTIGNSNSYAALIWASLSAVTVAMIMTLAQKMMSLNDAVETMTHGFKAMMGAILILIMAWALQGITNDMHTADFVISQLGDSLSPVWIPAITFVLAGLISFSTGSSWSTMAILYPLIIPLTWQVSVNTGLDTTVALPIFYNMVASLLAGSVLGDHCSPISDTTILSSMASSCNHVDHVRTQLPYAMVVGVVCTLVGIIPTAFGLPNFLSMILAAGVLFAIVRFVGKPLPETN